MARGRRAYAEYERSPVFATHQAERLDMASLSRGTPSDMDSFVNFWEGGFTGHAAHPQVRSLGDGSPKVCLHVWSWRSEVVAAESGDELLRRVGGVKQ